MIHKIKKRVKEKKKMKEKQIKEKTQKQKQKQKHRREQIETARAHQIVPADHHVLRAPADESDSDQTIRSNGAPPLIFFLANNPRDKKWPALLKYPIESLWQNNVNFYSFFLSKWMELSSRIRFWENATRRGRMIRSKTFSLIGALTDGCTVVPPHLKTVMQTSVHLTC